MKSKIILSILFLFLGQSIIFSQDELSLLEEIRIAKNEIARLNTLYKKVLDEKDNAKRKAKSAEDRLKDYKGYSQEFIDELQRQLKEADEKLSEANMTIDSLGDMVTEVRKLMANMEKDISDRKIDVIETERMRDTLQVQLFRESFRLYGITNQKDTILLHKLSKPAKKRYRRITKFIIRLNTGTGTKNYRLPPYFYSIKYGNKDIVGEEKLRVDARTGWVHQKKEVSDKSLQKGSYTFVILYEKARKKKTEFKYEFNIR